jgi:membrane-associated protease RseP (regulator of RpoE activity)
MWKASARPSSSRPWEQISDAVRHMGNLVSKLLSPKSDLSPAHMSGPVGVGRLYYKLFQHPDGWRLVLWFSVVFNINLAILNMMPFPVLDGGHITMAAPRPSAASRRREAHSRVCADRLRLDAVWLHHLCHPQGHRRLSSAVVPKRARL